MFIPAQEDRRFGSSQISRMAFSILLVNSFSQEPQLLLVAVCIAHIGLFEAPGPPSAFSSLGSSKISKMASSILLVSSFSQEPQLLMLPYVLLTSGSLRPLAHLLFSSWAVFCIWNLDKGELTVMARYPVPEICGIS